MLHGLDKQRYQPSVIHLLITERIFTHQLGINLLNLIGQKAESRSRRGSFFLPDDVFQRGERHDALIAAFAVEVVDIRHQFGIGRNHQRRRNNGAIHDDGAIITGHIAAREGISEQDCIADTRRVRRIKHVFTRVLGGVGSRKHDEVIASFFGNIEAVGTISTGIECGLGNSLVGLTDDITLKQAEIGHVGERQNAVQKVALDGDKTGNTWMRSARWNRMQRDVQFTDMLWCICSKERHGECQRHEQAEGE